MRSVVRLGFVACLLAGSLIIGCGGGAAAPPRDVRVTPRTAAGGTHTGKAINQFEMQEEIQRFTSTFMSNVLSASDQITEGDEDLDFREEALRRVLIYSSSALEIASGPLPEVNALDMVVFITLSRSVLERHWLPNVFGERGQPLLVAFKASEQEVWELSSKVLTPQQQTNLATLIESWLKAHPQNMRVESVRFTEFAQIAGEVETEQRQLATGLLGSVTAVTQTADHALLLSERAMFLAHRMPFLFRFQARLGAAEMIEDTMEGAGADLAARLAAPGPLMSDMITLKGQTVTVMGDLVTLTVEARRTLEELRLMTDGIRPILEDGKLQQTIDGAHSLTNDAQDLLREAREVGPRRAEETMLVLEARAQAFSRRMLIEVGLLGAGLIFLFWAGYYTVKRIQPSDRAPGNHPRFPRSRPSHP